MKNQSLKWSIYLLALCSFPQCSHLRRQFSNEIEDNMKDIDENISKPKSYFRQNWESPINFLIKRDYIPRDKAKPDKFSRNAIEEREKDYEDYDYDQGDLNERSFQLFENRKRKDCVTTTEATFTVNTEATTCRTIKTTEELKTTTSAQPTCEPVTLNPLEETTTCAPGEIITSPSTNDESSTEMKSSTPSPNIDECEYEDTATDYYNEGEGNQETPTTTTQPQQNMGDDPDENSDNCDPQEERTTTAKPNYDKPRIDIKCLRGKSYGVATSVPLRFQFDYPALDYPLKVENKIVPLKESPGPFELAKEIADNVVAEYSHNINELAKMGKSSQSNDIQKRLETKTEDPSWYSHPKQALFHYSLPLLQDRHQKTIGKIIQKPYSRGLEPVGSEKFPYLAKSMPKTELEPKQQFSKYNKNTGKGSSIDAFKSESAQNDGQNEDYYDDDFYDYIGVDASCVENKLDKEKNDKISQSKSIKPEKIKTATEVNQNLDYFTPRSGSDYKHWTAIKNIDESKKQFSETVSESPNDFSAGKNKMIFNGSLGGDFSVPLSYSSDQSNRNWLNSKMGKDNASSQALNSIISFYNLNLTGSYTNPNDLNGAKGNSHLDYPDKTFQSKATNSNDNRAYWPYFKTGETENEFFRTLEAKYLNKYQKLDNLSEHHKDWEHPVPKEEINRNNDLSSKPEAFDYYKKNSFSTSPKLMDYKSSKGFYNNYSGTGTSGGIGNVYSKLATTKPQHASSTTKNKINDAYLNNYLVPTFDSDLKPKNRFLMNEKLAAKKAKESVQHFIPKQNYKQPSEFSYSDMGKEKKVKTDSIESGETYNDNSIYSQKEKDIKYPSESILNLYRYKNMNKNLEDVFKYDKDRKTTIVKPYSYYDGKSAYRRYFEPRLGLTQQYKDIVKQAANNITTNKFPEEAFENLQNTSTHELYDY